VPTICPFCDLPSSRVRLENDVAVAIPDAFPVAEGHVLVVPRRHVASLFDLPEEEQAAVWRLVAAMRNRSLAGNLPTHLQVESRLVTLGTKLRFMRIKQRKNKGISNEPSASRQRFASNTSLAA
jgi:hypothetical protein